MKHNHPPPPSQQSNQASFIQTQEKPEIKTRDDLEMETPPQQISWIDEATEVSYGLQKGIGAPLSDHSALHTPGPLTGDCFQHW